MPKLLVLQHVAHEILGTLDPLLRDAGFRIKYVNFERHPDAEPELEGYDGLIVLGGPMNVDEVDKYPNLQTEMNLIKRAVEKEFPILAICLGSQLLAKALGAKVRKNPEKEKGCLTLPQPDVGKTDLLTQNFSHEERLFTCIATFLMCLEVVLLLAFRPLFKTKRFSLGTY